MAHPGSGPGLASNPQAADEAEGRLLKVIAAREEQRRGMANVPREDGRLLRLFVESLGAQQVVEVGTSNGYSGLWIALGLLRTGGRLTTFEVDPRRAERAKSGFKEAGVEERVTLVLGDAHKTVSQVKGPIDLLFLDADKAGYLDYLTQLLPRVRPGGLVVAHNMVSPPPDPRFLQAITQDPRLETLFLNLQGPGLAVCLKKRAP